MANVVQKIEKAPNAFFIKKLLSTRTRSPMTSESEIFRCCVGRSRELTPSNRIFPCLALICRVVEKRLADYYFGGDGMFSYSGMSCELRPVPGLGKGEQLSIIGFALQ